MKVITIANQKGGVGKTATAHALGAGLKQRGYKVLFIDLDGQGNLTHDFNVKNPVHTSLDLLTGTATANECTTLKEIIPSSPNLAVADGLITDTGKEYRLEESLATLKGYDFVIIDTPPATNILTVNALTACDYVIIPAQAETYSLMAIATLNESIKKVKRYTNGGINVLGVLITRFNGRGILTREMQSYIEQTAQAIGTTAFKTHIRECIAIKESQAAQCDIFNYAPKSNAATDYNEFITEVLERI